MLDLVLLATETGGGGSDNPLIKVAPGLMIWTLICFGITFFVLKRFAFGAIQKAIDQRRERSASHWKRPTTRATRRAACSRSTARCSARRGARRTRSSARRAGSQTRSAERAPGDDGRRRQRRLEETRAKSKPRRSALSEIRREVADLALIAAEKVTSRALRPEDHRRLIDEAIGELDFSVLEREPAR